MTNQFAWQVLIGIVGAGAVAIAALWWGHRRLHMQNFGPAPDRPEVRTSRD